MVVFFFYITISPEFKSVWIYLKSCFFHFWNRCSPPFSQPSRHISLPRGGFSTKSHVESSVWQIHNELKKALLTVSDKHPTPSQLFLSHRRSDKGLLQRKSYQLEHLQDLQAASEVLAPIIRFPAVVPCFHKARPHLLCPLMPLRLCSLGRITMTQRVCWTRTAPNSA